MIERVTPMGWAVEGPGLNEVESKNFSGVSWGHSYTRAAWLARRGASLCTSLSSGDIQPSAVHWDGADLSSHGLMTASGASEQLDAGAWKRFLDAEVIMTCTPDPATETYGSAGSGTSSTDYRLHWTTRQGTKSVITNTTTGSGTDARTSTPPAGVSHELMSHTVSVVTDTNTEVEITETWVYDRVIDGTHSSGFTVQLSGHWWNGQLISTLVDECWTLYQATTWPSGAAYGIVTLDDDDDPSSNLGLNGDWYIKELIWEGGSYPGAPANRIGAGFSIGGPGHIGFTDYDYDPVYEHVSFTGKMVRAHGSVTVRSVTLYGDGTVGASADLRTINCTRNTPFLLEPDGSYVRLEITQSTVAEVSYPPGSFRAGMPYDV
jgi:hypothetical protein